MPARKGSIDKSFGRKVLDSTKFARNMLFYGTILALSCSYLSMGSKYDIWTPKQYAEQFNQKEHVQDDKTDSIDSIYKKYKNSIEINDSIIKENKLEKNIK